MYQSDQRRSPGHLSRQGPSTLRSALYEAAVVASRTGSPDRDYYLPAAERLGHKRACLAIARKLLNAATTRCENSARRHSYPHEHLIVRQRPTSADAPRPAPGRLLPPRPRGRRTNADKRGRRRLSSAARSALRATLRVTGRRRWRSTPTMWPGLPRPRQTTSPHDGLTRGACTDKQSPCGRPSACRSLLLSDIAR